MSESIRAKRQREELEYRKVQRAMNYWSRHGRTIGGRSKSTSGRGHSDGNPPIGNRLTKTNVYRHIEEEG